MSRPIDLAKPKNRHLKQEAMNKRDEMRTTKQTILTEVVRSAESRYGRAFAGQIALELIKALDHNDEWWHRREGWHVLSWLEWTNEQMDKLVTDKAHQQKEEPAGGYHNMYVKE
jgi:hypothetical protein